MGHPTILYVAPRLPYPLSKGMAIRQFHLLRAYAEVGKVSLVFFYENAEELEGIEALKPYCASFHPVSLHTTYGESEFYRSPVWRRRVGQLLTLKYSLANIYFSSEMRRIIEEIAPTSDLIHVARLPMVPHIERLLNKKGNGRFILDIDDIETVRKRREIQTNPIEWRKRALQYLDLFRLWMYQKKTLRLFDRVFVCSKRDRLCFGNGRVTIVPNGANVPPRILPDESDGKTILYLATLSYRPNIDGLFFFLKKIFPVIQKEVTGARLLIVGRTPPPEVWELHDGKTIWVEGNVPSVERYYRQATISIIPLRIGGGTRLKILEAFALGKPVVSTSVGCEGLEALNMEHLSIADDPQAFAKSCIELIRNPELRERLASRARKLVEQNYRWESIRLGVEKLAKDLLTGIP